VACGQEALNGEIATISEAITRTRSRIVQSPDRIRRTITTMTSATVEDRKTVTMHEAKARELQGKINALLAIEKVRSAIAIYGVRLIASIGHSWLCRAAADDREGSSRPCFIAERARRSPEPPG
jgi:hypothetical protein